MEKLTKRQYDILQTVKKFMAVHGYPPTVREIGKELNLSVDYILGLSNNVKWLEKEIELNINGIIKELNNKEINTLYVLLKTYLENK